MQQIIDRLRKEMVDYQSIPFWSWNDKLEEQELRRQIRWMKEMGIGGFFMHARGGLKTEYLSEEWMKCIDVCCDEAEKLGMHAWAYDENGWPSGFVGGKLLEDMENRDRYILSTIGEYDEKANVSYRLTEERLERVTEGGEEGEYLNLYIRYSASTVDVLNPNVVEQFISETHEKYKEHMGEDFSQKLKGFFTDEPQYYRWNTPYTPVMETYYMEQYQEDIMDKLGLLFVEKEGWREFRYRYWLSMQRLMLQNFAKTVYDWCEEHQIAFTGHYIEEMSMGFQNSCCAGVMPFYQYMHMPGIDWLGRDTTKELPARQLGSVARQMGKSHALTETFACCGWDVTPAQLRRIAGFQYVNGVNKMCQHLLPYSEAGQRKRDHPEHFTPLNPWVKEHFREFNDYFTRLGYLLGSGEEVVRVAMLHPQRSTYFDYKRELGDEGGAAVQELDQALAEACRLLSARGIAYHFLDETLLEEHGYVKGTQIGCGQCDYDYLVLPKMHTMGKSTERMIREFAERGGKLLLLDDAPQYLEGQPNSYEYLKSNCTLEELVHVQPFTVSDTENELYYAYREIDGKPFLYVQNASETECFTQTFCFRDGSCSFVQLDPITLHTEDIPLTVTLHENEGVLLFPAKKEVKEKKELNEIEVRLENASVEFDQNHLVMNVVRYSKDGKNYSKPMYRGVLFRHLLEQRYEGTIWLKYEFEIEQIPECLTIMSEQNSVAHTFINGQPFEYTETCEDDSSFCMADITSLVQVGQNAYETELYWHQSEATYYALFGENVTETLKNCIVYECEIEAVYLSGKFGVYSHDEWEPYEDNTVLGHSFYIGKIPERVTELVTEGFPFFKGKMTLRQNITLETSDSILNIKGRYLTTHVRVNGKDTEFKLFDTRVDISEMAVTGENLLEAEFTISDRNFFGPFHCTQPDAFLYPDFYDICDLPRGKNGELQYRLRLFQENR